MDHLKGLLFMGGLIVFIFVSSFFFKGNKLADDDCTRYSFLANDC